MIEDLRGRFMPRAALLSAPADRGRGNYASETSTETVPVTS